MSEPIAWLSLAIWLPILTGLSPAAAGVGIEAWAGGVFRTDVRFLGAGVMISQEGVVKGVTTGAVIWILAAIGSLIGLGHMKAAITISLITVAILVGKKFTWDSVAMKTSLPEADELLYPKYNRKGWAMADMTANIA